MAADFSPFEMEQPAELLCKFGGAAIEQSGRLSPGHDFMQGGTARLAPMESCAHTTAGDELRPERSQYARQGLAVAQHGQVSGYLQPPSALADACN
jgi:hypothetical protein